MKLLKCRYLAEPHQTSDTEQQPDVSFTYQSDFAYEGRN